MGPYPQNAKDVSILSQTGIRAVLNLQTQWDVNLRGIRLEQIQHAYQESGIEHTRFEILDMNIEDFIVKGYQAAQLLKKLVDKFEVSWP